MTKRNIDYPLLISIMLITVFGLFMVYSASNVVALTEYNDSYYYLKRQFLFWVLGLIVMIVISKFDALKLKKYSSIVFIICFTLLLLVIIPFIGTVRGGARSWIGFASFTIQPSEFMKLGLVMVYAKYLSDNYSDLKKFVNFLMLFSLAILIFLIIMLQPDFGTGLVIVLTAMVLIFISGVPIKYFVFLGIFALIGIAVLIISAPYRLERITAFIDPWSDPLGSGFQGIQSLFAITPGGLFGHGYNNSIQKHFFLPEPQNDFIFAIVIEEMGLIGGAILLFLYFFVIYRGIKISLKVEDNYLKFLTLGIIISLFIQVVINVCVVVGLLPVTGITLPLFSYGGSSLLITMTSLGIVLSASSYRNYD